MNADGSEPRRLTSSPGEDENLPGRPDGTRLAFWSSRDGNQEIYVMEADGSGQTNLTNSPSDEGWPSWSPDGGRIAFDRDDEVFVMNADGTAEELIATGSDPSWSPDGEWLAFSAQEGARSEIVVARTDGSQRTNLTRTDDAAEWDPSWAADGTITFDSNRDAARKIALIDPDGAGLEIPAGQPDAALMPTWSPTGARLAFVGRARSSLQRGPG